MFPFICLFWTLSSTSEIFLRGLLISVVSSYLKQCLRKLFRSLDSMMKLAVSPRNLQSAYWVLYLRQTDYREKTSSSWWWRTCPSFWELLEKISACRVYNVCLILWLWNDPPPALAALWLPTGGERVLRSNWFSHITSTNMRNLTWLCLWDENVSPWLNLLIPLCLSCSWFSLSCKTCYFFVYSEIVILLVPLLLSRLFLWLSCL